MRQGLYGLQTRAANHRRNYSNFSSNSKFSNYGASDKENRYHQEQEDDMARDDSGICLRVVDSGDREVQKAKSKPLSLGCKSSSFAIDGAGVGVSSNQPRLKSVSGTSEYRPSDVITRSTSGDSQNQKEFSGRHDRPGGYVAEVYYKLSQSNSASESTESSCPLLSQEFPLHAAHPMQQHGQQLQPFGRPRELLPAEEAVHMHSVGREGPLDQIPHGRHQPPSPPPLDGRNSISPSNLGQFTPAAYVSEAPEVPSLRRGVEDKLKNLEGLKIDLNSLREHNKSRGEGVAAIHEEHQSLQRQVQHFSGGTLSTMDDNVKERDDEQNNLTNLQKCSESPQKKARSREENAECIQVLWDTDRQIGDAERSVSEKAGGERDNAQSGLIDLPEYFKSPPMALSPGPQIQQETPQTTTAPQCSQQRDHLSRRSTSISECVEDARHRRAGHFDHAQVSPNSAEALDSPRAEHSLSGFTSESVRSFTDSVGSCTGFETGCEQLNDLLQQLHEALVREMVQDYMTNVGNLSHKAHTPSDSATSSNSKAEARQGDSAIPKPSSAAKGKGKRRRDDKDGDGNDDQEDENPDRRRHKRQGTAGSNSDVVPEKLFACPYFKLDASRYSQRNVDEKKYRGCSSCYLIDISRLKQHLYRVHGRPDHYCGSCFQDFKTRVLLDAHTRQRPSCKLSERPFDEKMDSDKKTQIKRRRFGQNPSEAWYDIWRILFPNSDAPESPFSEIASAIAVQSLFERFQTQAPLILSRLVRDRIDDSIDFSDYEQLLLQNAQEEAMAEVIQTFRREFEDLELSMTVTSSNNRRRCTGRNSPPSASPRVSVVLACDQSTRVSPIALPEIVSSAASGAPLGNEQHPTIEFRSFQASSASLPTLGLPLTPGEVIGPNWSYSNKPDDMLFFGNATEQTGADVLTRICNSGAQQLDVLDHEHHLWHINSPAASADYPWFGGLGSSSHYMHD